MAHIRAGYRHWFHRSIWFHPPGPNLIKIFYSVQKISIQLGIFQLHYHFCANMKEILWTTSVNCTRNPLTKCIVRNIINVSIKKWVKTCWRFMVKSAYVEMDGVLQCCNEKNKKVLTSLGLCISTTRKTIIQLFCFEQPLWPFGYRLKSLRDALKCTTKSLSLCCVWHSDTDRHRGQTRYSVDDAEMW